MKPPSRTTRREILRWTAAGAATVAVPSLSLADSRTKRPNFIVIMADDVSAKDFTCYGHPQHRTPVLDELARAGVQFRTCWCTPMCSPTRAEILTGRYGFRTGWLHNSIKPGKGERGFNLGADNETFADLLKSAGYATAICGKWQLRGTPSEHGFDEYCLWQKYDDFDGPVEKRGHGKRIGRAARYWHPAIVRNNKPVRTTANDYGPDIFTEFVLDFAKRHKAGPFCIYYPMCLPHGSYDFDARRSGYLPTPKTDAKGSRISGRRAGSLWSNVEYIDVLIGRIVRGLEALDLRKDTIVLFTSDNGTAGYGKCKTHQERGPRVPMVVNCPGRVKARGAVDDLTDFSDILATLCDLGGATIPDGYAIDGQSFAGVLAGKPGPREWIYSFYADRRFLRDKRYLLDGNNRLWDCGPRRDEKGYKDVTDSDNPQVVAVRKRFAGILKRLPAGPSALIDKARRGGKKFLPPPLKRPAGPARPARPGRARRRFP